MSTIKVKTPVFQDMVAKAIKGASNNKHIPITSLMLIKVSNKILSLGTTDASNYLTIRQDKFDAEDFYVVVHCEKFAKLVAKTTVEFITLEHIGTSLKFIGNGTYMLELPVDENDQLIIYPEPLFDITESDPKTLHLSTAKVILGANKAALAETMEIPCYMNYYCAADEHITSTDTFTICDLEGVTLFDKDVLVTPEMMNLLTLMTEEKIDTYYNNGEILFHTQNCSIQGRQADGIEEFNVGDVRGVIGMEFPSSCKLPKSAFLSLLDRLALFVTEYDKNGVLLNFTKDGLHISSKKSTGVEVIVYQSSKDFKNFICTADIHALRSQVAAQPGESVEIHYGVDGAIKMISGKITQILSLLDEEETEDGTVDSPTDGE